MYSGFYFLFCFLPIVLISCFIYVIYLMSYFPSILLLGHVTLKRNKTQKTEGTWRFSSVQLLSCVRLFATPWTAARQASLSITNSWSMLKLMSIMDIQPSHSLSFPSPPAFNLSQHQGLFSSESVLRIRWPQYWNLIVCCMLFYLGCERAKHYLGHLQH